LRQTLEDDTIIDMFKKKPVLQYESAVDIYPNIITPAKNHVPEWYKKISKWENNEIFTNEKGFQKTIKQCIPFLDSLITGYMIVLPNDLYVKNNNGSPFITWNGAEFPPKSRNSVADLNLVPAGHYPTEFIWQTGVANTIPLGFSMLLTHPINRYDLPFTTLTGIVDGGFIMSINGNIPFYVKEGFEGVIPQGTPIAQLIPFRQENWLSKKTKGLVLLSNQDKSKSNSLIYGWYKKTFWTRKKYD
jgi:hypothetical protein